MVSVMLFSVTSVLLLISEIDFLSKQQPFKFRFFHVGEKVPTRKLYNRFHVGKNGIHLGNFQNCIFPNIQLKVLVNRLPPFKNLYDQTNRPLMRVITGRLSTI